MRYHKIINSYYKKYFIFDKKTLDYLNISNNKYCSIWHITETINDNFYVRPRKTYFLDIKNNIYFLNFYHPQNTSISKHETEFSQNIIYLKNGYNNAILYFNYFFEVFDFIDKHNIQAIVIVPSSTQNNYNNGIYRLAELISKHYNIFYDKYLIKRFVSLPPSHLGNKHDIDDHLKTLKINNSIPKNVVNILILDDLFTKGNSINSVEFLLKNKFKTLNIFKLTLGHTYNKLFYEDFREHKIQIKKINKNNKDNKNEKIYWEKIKKLLPDSPLKNYILFNNNMPYLFEDVFLLLEKFNELKKEIIQQYGKTTLVTDPIIFNLISKNIKNNNDFSKIPKELRNYIDKKEYVYIPKLLKIMQEFG